MCFTNTRTKICDREYDDLLRANARMTWGAPCKGAIQDHIISNRLTPLRRWKQFSRLLQALYLKQNGRNVENLMRPKVKDAVTRVINEMVKGKLIRRKSRGEEVYYAWRSDADNFIGVGGWHHDWSVEAGRLLGNKNRKPRPSDAPGRSKPPTPPRRGKGTGRLEAVQANTAAGRSGDPTISREHDDDDDGGTPVTYNTDSEASADSSDDDDQDDDDDDVDDDTADDDSDEGCDDASDAVTKGDSGGDQDSHADSDTEMKDAPPIKHQHDVRHCHHWHKPCDDPPPLCPWPKSPETSSSPLSSSCSFTPASTATTPITPVTQHYPAPESKLPSPQVFRLSTTMSVCSLAPSESVSSIGVRGVNTHQPMEQPREMSGALVDWDDVRAEFREYSAHQLFTMVDETAEIIIGLLTRSQAMRIVQEKSDFPKRVETIVELHFKCVEVIKEVLVEKTGWPKEIMCFGGEFWWWMKYESLCG
ncbi:hypothetical protein NM208_g1831 [Fusarium decemcellulare]|uniref:Uncharacterized protein n=1 Tax=Fusarium decemcellulare TaxID=57161 RepID=A0ACC1SV09_9HYPO|nr:hypothetical protein NM208_g1831 [Fusarium decemcellulare]